MENQTINCSVSSCRHHNAQNRCELRSINVCANCNCHSGKSDESMSAAASNERNVGTLSRTLAGA